MATTSEIKIIKKILNQFMHHQVELIKRNRKINKKNPTSCMSMLFLVVKEYFRVQWNLFNYLWNLKYIAYRKEILKVRASRTSFT